ncbi:MAG: hypothetical protein H6996_03060 [Moraxellaceae bacterium]|nr:hypothetical protein [Pseudomonadales bacterium]MCP5174070.1 hypothetical protein [Moraxellaceae bacterium]MCP5176344.1 hypothetical protein [Moraxellaceae bacterium]
MSTCQHCQSRRQFLSTSLVLGAGLILPDWSFAGGFSHSLGDKVWVNGRLAHQKSRINANSTIKTGSQDTAFVIGNNAFKLRANSEVKFTALNGGKAAISTLRLITGGLLSVFGAGNKKLITNTATIGIRGTGVYMESSPQSSYVCLCYGKVDLAANQTPDTQIPLEAKHHLGQLISDNGSIDNHAMQGHTDEELVELEALVGRKVPFTYPYTG